MKKRIAIVVILAVGIITTGCAETKKIIYHGSSVNNEGNEEQVKEQAADDGMTKETVSEEAESSEEITTEEPVSDEAATGDISEEISEEKTETASEQVTEEADKTVETSEAADTVVKQNNKKTGSRKKTSDNADNAGQAAQEEPAEQNDGAASVRTEVSRTFIEDCGSDSGYWDITYSDGTHEYIDVP